MNYKKNNFKLREHVKVNLINVTLTGFIASPPNKSPICDSYNVILDSEYLGFLAIEITEACLEKI